MQREGATQPTATPGRDRQRVHHQLIGSLATSLTRDELLSAAVLQGHRRRRRAGREVLPVRADDAPGLVPVQAAPVAGGGQGDGDGGVGS